MGPSGQVFLGGARDGSRLAVRRYQRELFADADVRRRLAAAATAASVPHGPHIALVTDSDTEAAAPWVARALVRGPSLCAAITETGPLPAASVTWLALGAARAVAALHEDALTHQAINPSNVLLEAGGAVLTDFGLSRVALTDGTATAADDVFMLGCVTFFAAAGRPPWGGSWPAGPITAPGALDMLEDQDLRGCPPSLLPLVTACLDPSPVGRPSAADLVARLAEIEDQPRSSLPAAVMARFADYRELPGPDPARGRFRRLRMRRGVLPWGAEPPVGSVTSGGTDPPQPPR